MGCVSSISKVHSSDDMWSPSKAPHPSLVPQVQTVTVAHKAVSPRGSAPEAYPSSIVYTVTRDGSIFNLLTPKSWASFAEANEVDLPAHTIVGRCLFAAMQPPLAAFYRELVGCLHGVEPGKRVSFRWYCDSPSVRREMVTVLQNIGPLISISTIPVDEHFHLAGFLERTILSSGASRKSCCLCNRFERHGGWLIPEAYYKELAHEGHLGSVAVAPTFCPDCLRQVVGRLTPRLAATLGYDDSRSTCCLDDSVLVSTHSSGPRVLIVEHDTLLAKVLEALLYAMDYIPFVLTDPSLVATFLQHTAVHAVLLDVAAPGLTGYSILRGLHQRGPHPPIICLANCTEHRCPCMRAGAEVFLLKPVTSVDLAAALAKFPRS